MMKLVLLTILLSFNVFSQEVEERRSRIISIIDEELGEVKRLSTRGGEKDPDLILRIAELYLEKARLFRERENANYLALPVKKRLKVDKKKYFSRSSKYFELANRECRKITSKFKRYSKMGEVYYILGYNSKEAGKFKNATNFLQKAGKNSRNKKVKIKSQLTLADIHFNNRKFSKAKKLYESSLKQLNDKWWTKDSFNLAWCYYHLNQYKAAINKMRDVYNRSRDPKYIDMRVQVERDIGLFYATSGKIDEGIKFYKKLGVKFTKRLFSIASTLKASGKFKDAEKVLNYATSYSKSGEERVDILLELLDIYQRSGRYVKHSQSTESVYGIHKSDPLKPDQMKSYLFQVEKVAAILQRQVLSKAYKRLKAQRAKKSRQARRYFEIMASLSQDRYDEFQFLKGETAYVTGQYGEAFTSYRRTFDFSVKNKKTKFKRKSMDNMLVTLSRFRKRYDLNIYAFETFIKHYPNDKRNKTIYGRLFNNYMSIKDYKKAESTLVRFSKKFPKDKTQEAMIAQLMEVSRKRGDNQKVRDWVLRIEDGEFFVSAKYKNKLQELLTTMQMEDVQSELKKGNKKFALKGYLEVLDDKYSTKRSKINAKYNIAALYYELGDVSNSHKWSILAINEMESKDVLKFQESLITIANFLFMSLQFDKSSHLSKTILEKICTKKSKRKETLFKNAGFMSLANGDIDKAEEVRSLGKKCKVKQNVIHELDYEIMRETYLRKDYKRFETYVMILSKKSSYETKLIDEYIKLSRIYNEYDNEVKKDNYFGMALKAFNKAKRTKSAIPISSLEYFASRKLKRMQQTDKRLRSIAIKFPEKVFQKSVQESLSLLDKMVEQANDTIQVGSGSGIIKSYLLLEGAYEYVANKLKTFVPPGKSKEYLAGFKKEFTGISNQMLSAAKRYRKEAQRAISKNKILSVDNFKLQDKSKLIIPVSYYGQGVLMDRGGVK